MRLALLQEGADALLEIVAAAEPALHVALQRQALRQVVAPGGADGALYAGIR